MAARLSARWRAFRRDRSANTVIVFGLALPVLMGVVAMAVDYSRAAAGKAKLQAVADGAALYSAREFQMAQSKPERIVAVAMSYAQSQAPDAQASATADPDTLTVNVALEKDYELTIGKAVFGGNVHVRVNATAKMTGGLPLCLVGLDQRAAGTIAMRKNARMTAPACLVYSDSTSPMGLISMDNAVMQAGYICSAGGRARTNETNYSPQPMTDCPVIPDPLAARTAPSDSACSYTDKVVDGEVASLSPGVYCGGLTVKNGADVTLRPGIFIIKDGPLIVTGNASLKGDNVGLFMKGGRCQPHLRHRQHHPADGAEGWAARRHPDLRRSKRNAGTRSVATARQAGKSTARAFHSQRRCARSARDHLHAAGTADHRRHQADRRSIGLYGAGGQTARPLRGAEPLSQHRLQRLRHSGAQGRRPVRRQGDADELRRAPRASAGPGSTAPWRTIPRSGWAAGDQDAAPPPPVCFPVTSPERLSAFPCTGGRSAPGGPTYKTAATCSTGRLQPTYKPLIAHLFYSLYAEGAP
jgi:Flp pilus assembly protein TadG